jgi:hypothetical protein
MSILRPGERIIQPAAWTAVQTDGTSAYLTWNGNFAGSAIESFNSLDCDPSKLRGSTPIETNWKSFLFDGMSPATVYSFRITGSESLPCINAKTTSFDPLIMPEASTLTVNVPISVNVKSGQQHIIMLDYRNEQKPNRIWKIIDDTVNGPQLFTILGADVETGSQLAIKAGQNCYFKTNGLYYSDILFTKDNLILTDTTSYGYTFKPTDLTITCNSSTNDGDGGENFGPPMDSTMFSERMTLVIAPSGFTMIEDKFLSPDCTKTRVSSRTELGTFVLPGPDSVPDTYPVDVTPKDLDGIFFMQEMVDRANSDPDQFACGIGGWAINTRQNLSNTKCASTGKTDYLRLKVIPSQTAGDRLYLCDPPGQDSEYGKTAATRIPTCDITSESFYFKRQ